MLAVHCIDDIFDHHRIGCRDQIEVRDIWQRVSGNNLGIEAGLFFDLAQGRLDQVFVRFNMPTGWQPLLNFFVPVKERRVLVNNETCGSEMSDHDFWIRAEMLSTD